MTAPLTLDPVPGMSSSWVMRGTEYVGVLYPPTSFGDGWEIWPTYQTSHPSLDTGTALFVSFATEADALAFLGISPSLDLAA